MIKQTTMINYNISEKEIAKSDFDSIVEIQGLKSYSKEHVEAFKQAQKDLMYKAEVEVLSTEEEGQMELFKAELDTLKSVVVVNNDLARETVYYRSNDSLTKSQEIEATYSEKIEQRNKLIIKSFEEGLIDDETLEKAVKYFKKEPKAGGGYKYYYTEAQYKKEKGGEEKKSDVLELRKKINEMKAQRNKLPNGSSKKQYLKEHIELLESKIVKDKDGNSIGIKGNTPKSIQQSEKKEDKKEGGKSSIRSIGVLNNADGSYTLTPVMEGQQMPVKVNISKEEYSKVKGDKEAMKKLAISKMK